MSTILLAQPGYGCIETESHSAAQRAVTKGTGDELRVLRTKSSLLAHNFNDCLAVCLNNGYEYFAMLHVDMAADPGWLTVLKDEMLASNSEVIHAPAAIKDGRGLTSTAIAYSDEDWSLVRRVTMTELQKLPETFTADDVRESFDTEALYLLPNTGCLLMKADTWLKDFPGFEVRDRIRRYDSKIWVSEVIPEDWNFGYWCGRNDVPVAGTRKVVTHHFGRIDHHTATIWGQPTDDYWHERKGVIEPLKMEVMTI